jgi:hypothetical protein
MFDRNWFRRVGGSRRGELVPVLIMMMVMMTTEVSISLFFLFCFFQFSIFCDKKSRQIHRTEKFFRSLKQKRGKIHFKMEFLVIRKITKQK